MNQIKILEMICELAMSSGAIALIVGILLKVVSRCTKGKTDNSTSDGDNYDRQRKSKISTILIVVGVCLLVVSVLMFAKIGFSYLISLIRLIYGFFEWIANLGSA